MGQWIDPRISEAEIAVNAQQPPTRLDVATSAPLSVPTSTQHGNAAGDLLVPLDGVPAALTTDRRSALGCIA